MPSKRSSSALPNAISLSRRKMLAGLAGAGAATFAGPHIWVPRQVLASTTGFGRIKHLLYIRLASGFRFPTAFNAGVAAEFNPFGQVTGAAGTEWGVSQLLAPTDFLGGANAALATEIGMKAVPEISHRIAVIPCVDHEPTAARADGNHGTGLERFNTGYVGGKVGFFTMINYGLRARAAKAQAEGKVALPPFVLGNAGLAIGFDKYAAHRPPILSGTDFDRFSFQSAGLPDWAGQLVASYDTRMRDRQHPNLRATVDGYIQARKATAAYGAILSEKTFRINDRAAAADTPVDGLTNTQLASMFGNSGAAQRVRLALRLFHYGCPAVYMDQGGYDYHSGEETQLPGQLAELCRIFSGLEAALRTLQHPEGGTYWDHTVVVAGSEFSRTARASRFNSARGSDHGGDDETRWMSMPFMGGPIAPLGKSLGATRASDLKATGKVYSYRSVLKTLMDGLGCDHQEFFPADAPFEDLYA